MTHPPRPEPGGEACARCGAPLAAEQQWCVLCGARQPGARTDALALLFAERRAAEAAAAALATASAVDAAASAASPIDVARRRRAAIPSALAALVGLFVVSGTNITASLAGTSQPPFTVRLPPQVAQHVAPAPVPAPPVDDAVEEPWVEPAPVEAAPEALAPTESVAPADPEAVPTVPPPVEAPAPESSPIQHVFLVVLGSTDVAALARDEAAAPYLAGTLAKSGTLLERYTTVSRGALANRIALVSGQGPTQETLADCTTYGDVRPADALDAGQTGGDGCVYGYETGHLGDQLRGLEKTWKAYVEPADEASPDRVDCEIDAETTRRNPFLWFRGTVEADDCDERNVPLAQLARDLEDPTTTPALSWIASDAQLGSAEADAFLERVVPQILNSLAYANGGLIVVTSDTPPPAAAPAPEGAPPATTPAPAPPAPPVPAPPADPTQPPAQTAPEPPPATTPTTPTTPTTTAPLPPPPDEEPPRAAADEAPVASAAAAEEPTPAPRIAPGPTSYPNVGDALAAGGGERVGALLISPFTPSGRVDATPANAFTLLRTLQQIYGADPLGYTADDAVRPLRERLFSIVP